MFRQLFRWLKLPSSSPRRPLKASRVRLELMALESRLTPSTSTSFVGGTLTLNINTGDMVTITETQPTPGVFKFAVSDSTITNIGGANAGPFSNVKNITVNMSATGAQLLVVGYDQDGTQTPTGIPGNFTVTDTKPNNAISVEVHDGFSVGGAITISNTGAGSTFLHHISTTNDVQDVTGVFFDPNNQAIYGSVTVTGSGSVGFDGSTVLGDVNVNLGNAKGNEFYVGKEYVFGQDPDSPPWTQFNFASNEWGGNLNVSGSSDTELYQLHVHGSISLTQGAPLSGGQGLVQLGNVSIGKSLSISTPSGVAGVFLDFSSVGGTTQITQGNGTNVIGLQTDTFGGAATFSQGSGTDYIFIDSEANFLALNGLPSDAPYLDQLSQADLLPTDNGSSFNGTVKSTQGSGTHELEIGQDASAITIFDVHSSFKAGSGTTIEEAVSSVGIHPTVTGY